MRTFFQFIDDKSLAKNLVKTTKSVDLLQELLSILRALYWNYQSSHWQANLYSNHLLFQRLYDNIAKEIDELAEKLVGYFNNETVENADSIKRTEKWLQNWKSTKDNVERAISAEKDFQKSLKYIYDQLKANDDMHLGLDDFLMGISSDHDSHLYLLGQIK